MKFKMAICIALLVLASSCGGEYAYVPPDDGVTGMELMIANSAPRVGELSEMAVRITMTDGGVVDGVKDYFTHPGTNETSPVEWETSDSNVAAIGENATLIPRSDGYAIITAQMGERYSSRTIRVVGTGDSVYSVSPQPNDDGDDGTDDDPADSQDPQDPQDPEDPQDPQDPIPVPCQGHAVNVFSFSPGAGAGFGDDYFPDIVLGAPEGTGSVQGSFDVLSLGRGGEIILDLGDCAVVDGPGVDLIVFENAFWINGIPSMPFAEPGAVAVSEDGANFVEYICNDAGYPYTGCAGWNPVYSSTSNAISPFDAANAGGDQFDLSSIAVERARYVRIRDVSNFGGSPSAGFDLDAIAVVNGELVQ